MDFINWYTSSPVVYVLSLICCVAATGIVGAWLYQDVEDNGWWD